MTLQQEYKRDPKLLALYESRLLEPGWAGQLADNEAEYIAKAVSKDPMLKGRWRRALREAGYTGQRRKRPSIYVIKMWNDFLVSVNG